MKIHSNWILLLIAGLLSSCTIFAPDNRTNLNKELPERFSLYTASEGQTTRWWETFQSPELNALINEALTNSPSIRQAWARLSQADAVASKAGASRYPSLNYNAGTGAQSIETTKQPNPGNDSFNSFNLGLSAAYELDLWGRVKSISQAAALDQAASREQLNTAAITLSSRVALAWIGLLTQGLQADVLNKQLDTNKDSLELVELRFKKSLASALDVYQQRQIIAATESTIPRIEMARTLQHNELAVLLGKPHPSALTISQSYLPQIGKLPDIGIPADLLANRPDVRQAGLKLQAADWQVSAARADRLPAIRLTASVSYGGNNIESSAIFDNWIQNLAANLTGPIFEGGLRSAEVKRTRAVAEERLEAYRETVLNAIREVEDALISEKRQHEYIHNLEQQIAAAKCSYEESINRYRHGLIEYTTVLTQLTILQHLERDRITSQQDLIRYRIHLYRALGGSWPDTLSNPFNGDQ